jgi:hypothetical protein
MERDALSTLLSTIRAASVEPLAAELLSGTCARRIGLEGEPIMLVRLAGNAVGVLHQRATLAKLADCTEVSTDVWNRLRQSDPANASVVRISRRPSELARLWMDVATRPDVDAHASLARGIVRLRKPDSHAMVMGSDSRDRIIVETMLPSDPFIAGPAPNDFLFRRLRDAFDPRRILNRGILGDEGA